MAKSGWTADDLKKRGLEQQRDGSYAKSSTEPLNPYYSYPKQKVNNSPDFELSKPQESYLVIPGLIPGLNGSKGLMRAHWSAGMKQKELYRSIIRDHLREGKVRKHSGLVMVTYIGHKSSLADWDNFSASFKQIGDSLVKEGVLIDDNPKIVQRFFPHQIKCKRSEQKVIVIIQDIC